MTGQPAQHGAQPAQHGAQPAQHGAQPAQHGGPRGQPEQPAQPGQRDPQALSAFTERYGALLAEAGFPPMPARVFAALLVTDSGRLTAAELSARLGISAAAVSGAVRYLAQLHMISREREPGSRRYVYHVINDVWYEVSISQGQLYTHLVNTARDGVEVLGPDSPAGRRMADTREYFAFLQRELPAVLARWRAYRAGRDSGGTREEPGPAR